MKFRSVTLTAAANIYFGGKVVSHTFHESDGTRNTVGVIFPGTYEFKTRCPEKMVITAGKLYLLDRVTKKETQTGGYGPGDDFEVAGDTSFRVVCHEVVEYVCIYLE